MSSIIVADASPLIALARIDLLDLLRDLYGSVLVPAEVGAELKIEEKRPGSAALRRAMEARWLIEAEIEPTTTWTALCQVLDPGEAAAIFLAEERKARFLLIDERRGRLIARKRGIRVVGTGGILLAAKERGMVDRIAPILDRLAANKYWLAKGLQQRILEIANE